MLSWVAATKPKKKNPKNSNSKIRFYFFAMIGIVQCSSVKCIFREIMDFGDRFIFAGGNLGLQKNCEKKDYLNSWILQLLFFVFNNKIVYLGQY